MKSAVVFIAAIALLFTVACGQKNEDAAVVADPAATGTDAVTDAADAVAETAAEISDGLATGALIDPNRASAEVIAAIPGIGAELAQQITAGRPYATPSALHAILKDAVDENTLKTIYGAMFVQVDLNTGSNADYQLIPSSLSPGHLAHEFEEYRPYSSIDQFEREMSKYVSAEEVAFLSRYVTIDD